MDSHRAIAIGIAVVGAAVWFGLFALALVATRPRPVPDAVPSQDFGGPEPPAVVSLLSNGWEVTEDAAESTLLDLAARRYLELRQPGNDPMQTTVHVRNADPTGLTAYEQLVLQRVAGLARNGSVPVTALTFREDGQAAAFAKRLRTEVVNDARERGLSRRRFSPTLVSLLSVTALLPAGAVSLAIGYAEYHGEKPKYDGVIGAGLVVFAILSGLAARPRGERDTDAGREAAGRWAGLRTWLRRDEAFETLPPAAVVVWDRYLSYGDALGATRVCAAVLDLGMGNRRRVWSHFGGAWHRVRVRYPRFWPRYGAGLPRVLIKAALAAGGGYVLLRYWRGFIADLATMTGDTGNELPQQSLVTAAGVTAGLVLVGYAGYALVRTVLDLIMPVELTGEVLWIELWKTTGGGNEKPANPYTYYLAVDDGSSERTTAWALPAEFRARCVTGDVVQLRARRWTRRITDLTLVHRGTTPQVPPATPRPYLSTPPPT